MDPISLLCINSYNLYMATLVGNPAPWVEKLNKELTNPLIGDLVIEISTIHHREHDKNRFGTLVKFIQTPVFTPAQWAEAQKYSEGNEPMPYEKGVVIFTSDGVEFTWTNASFIKVIQGLR
jgi:hypothetical protein